MELQFHDVAKRYGAKEALRGIDLTLSPGVYGLLGPNRSGALARSVGPNQPISPRRPRQVTAPQGLFRTLSLCDFVKFQLPIRHPPSTAVSTRTT